MNDEESLLEAVLSGLGLMAFLFSLVCMLVMLAPNVDAERGEEVVMVAP